MTAPACDNCGAVPAVVPCRDVWRDPHTHPRSLADMTPEPCSLMLCEKCERRVSSNLAARRRLVLGGDTSHE